MVENVTNLNPQIITCLEGTTHGSFALGDIVYTDSAGRIILGTSNKVFGIAHAGYTGTAGTPLAVELINEFDLYSIPYATTTSQGIIGQYNDLTYTHDAQVVAATQGSNKDVFIVGLDPRDALGTSGGRLLVRFNFAANATR
jgi:copper oxidase (laccase) domain-containing protein